MDSLQEKEDDELRALYKETLERLTDLRNSFMSLRAGGCAMETLLEDGETEAASIATEMERRGLKPEE